MTFTFKKIALNYLQFDQKILYLQKNYKIAIDRCKHLAHRKLIIGDSQPNGHGGEEFYDVKGAFLCSHHFIVDVKSAYSVCFIFDFLFFVLLPPGYAYLYAFWHLVT